MKSFCMQCGGPLIFKVPTGDDRKRLVCSACTAIYYQNPKMVVGAIPLVEGKILLCRRAIEPKRGLWTLPAGYLENGETVLDCARRESEEEAKAVLGALEAYALCNLTFIDQLYFFYRAQLLNDDFGPGSESLEVRLFSPEEIPWRQLAFTVVEEVLRQYCRDLEQNTFPFREFDIAAPSKKA